jgi:hypothetical protein
MEETFEQWSERLNTLSDKEVSEEIKKVILERANIDDESKKVFNDCYEYFMKNINAGKTVDTDLLKIYLKDIKGYNTDNINIYQILLLLSFCGINVNVNKS